MRNWNNQKRSKIGFKVPKNFLSYKGSGDELKLNGGPNELELSGDLKHRGRLFVAFLKKNQKNRRKNENFKRKMQK